MARFRAVVLATVLLFPVTCTAEVDVEPDRPDVANSTKTVPPGYLQIESGYSFTKTSVGAEPATKRSSAETSVRFGVTQSLELRLDGEPYVSLWGGERAGGFGDIAVAAKWRVRDAPNDGWSPSVGILPFLKLPTAAEPLGSGRPDFGVIGLMSFELPASLSLDSNVGVAAIGQADRDDFRPQAQAAVSLGHKVFEPLTVFGEVFFASREQRDASETIGFDAGIIWIVHRRLALDLGVETTLKGRGPDFGVRGGLTVLFGR